MSITSIDNPLAGERVVALSPENANAAATDWLRRPNLFAGRALTAPTLEQRQRWQAGRIAVRGQALTSGVVRGLEVGYAVETDSEGAAVVRLRVTPGRALAVSGEDVVLPTPVEFRLLDLPVVAEPAVFAEAAGEAPGGPPGPGGLGVLRPRTIGTLRLGELIAVRPDILPPAGVLVLQPVIADRSDFDPTDPCDRCPCAEATEAAPDSFEDWRTADGVRLLWYAWPDEWRALPPAGPRRRNALAHIVFDAEAMLAHGEALPWEQWGAPIALFGMNSAWQPLFADRAAVARQGGRARDARLALAGSAQLAADSRLPGLWQARIEQLAEQLAELGDPPPAPATLAQAFGRLPPAGLLPTNVLDLSVLPLNLATEALRSDFFPAGFELDAVPVPLPQLDVAIRAAAPLASIDFSATERLRVLVPVTQASYEPRLLYEEVVADEFQQTLDRFLLTRARALGARQGLRNAVAALTEAAIGTAPTVPPIAADPLALEPEDLTPWGPPPTGGGHRARLAAGRHQHFFLDATARLAPAAGDQLYAWVYLDPDHPPRTLMLQWHAGGSWEHRAYWGANLIDWGTDGTASRRRIDEQLPALGRWLRLAIDPASLGLDAATPIDGMAFTLFDGRAAYGPSGLARATGDSDWFSSLLPEGARVGGDYAWEFLSENDLWAPFEAAIGLAAPSVEGVPAGGGHVEQAARGTHQHFFLNATATLPVSAGQRLFAWVWLDPENPPRELMLQWNVGGSWEHRGYFGENLIDVGTEGNASRRRIGALPALGVWVRLGIAAAEVGLEGQTVAGMAFTLFDGRAAFGAAGRLAADGAETVWFSGALPAGAVPTGTWSLLTPQQMPAPLGAPPTGVVPAVATLRADATLAPLSGRERAQLDLRGVEGFIAFLRSRADRADDLVDYGFVKVQTDVYRVRQLVLGTTAATRLAVSPALATIAQAQTAVASQQQISTFYQELVGATPPPTAVASNAVRGGGGGEGGGTPPAAFEAGNPGSSVPRSARAGVSGATSAGERLLLGGTAGTGLAESIGGQPAIGIAGATFGAGTVATAAGNANIVRGLTQETGVIGLTATTFDPSDVINAPPIVGKANIRTTAIAQRLEDPKAIEAKDYTAATRHEAVSALVRLADQLRAEDGGVTPGLFEGIDVYGVRDDQFLGAENTTRRLPLASFIANRALLTQLLTTPVRTRPVPGAQETLPDEGAYFSDSADLSDNTVALMRQLEGRIKLYRDAIAAAERTLATLRQGITLGNARLTAIADTLAEARHDVSVARALLAEETDRIAGINQHRAEVLAQEVRFLAFVRPREADNLASVPLHQVDPGLLEAPAPACLAEHPDVPEQLTDMLRVVREAPATWFVDVPKLFDRLDRSDLLVKVLHSAQVRTQLLSAAVKTPAAVAAAPANRLQGAISSVKARQLQVVSQARALVTQLDLSRVRDLTWQRARDQASEVVSLGDLIDGEHGRGEVARRAAQTFEEIGRIAACLHAAFSEVLPSIRLDWAEVLSQFDQAPSLRRLGSLARWGEIGYADRYRMQAFADWLFARVNVAEPRAEALMNDVVRMCLLLASHAPVGRIIAGRLPRPVTVRPGVLMPLTAFEVGKLRVGMQVLVYRASSVVARATVEDIGATEISARVVHTSQPQIDLDVNVRVQFSPAAQVSLAAASKPVAGMR